MSRGCAELSPSLTDCCALESWSQIWPQALTCGSTVELALVIGMRVSQPQESECERVDPSTCLPWGGPITDVVPSPTPNTSLSQESCPQGHGSR